jgi:hypothetical protein
MFCFLTFLRFFLLLLVLVLCSGFAGGISVGFSRHLHSEALLVFRTNRFSHPGLWRSSGGFPGLVCACVAFERRKGGKFSTSIGTRTGLPRHQLFRRSLSTNLFLCVWEGRRQMDGWMEKSDLFDWLYRGLFYLIGYARLAITIWKDVDGRKEGDFGGWKCSRG